MEITENDPIAQYNSRTMLPSLTQGNMPEMFLRSFFINSEQFSDTDIIQIDIEKSGETVAAFVSRTGDAEQIGKRNYSTNMHAVPYLYQELTILPKDLKVREMGQSVFEQGASKPSKLQNLIAKGLLDMRNSMRRNEETQIAAAIQTGIVVVSGVDVDYTVDFQMDADHLIDVAGGGDEWSDVNADILGQLQVGATLIQDSGAPTATSLILGTTAANNFLKNTVIKELLDTKNYDIGAINFTQLSQQKAVRLGKIAWNGFDLEVFSYSAKYKIPGGAVVPYLATDSAVMGSKNTRFDMHYGMIENMQNTFGIAQFPDRDSSNKKKELITLESAPLVGFHQPDGFVRIKTEV